MVGPKEAFWMFPFHVLGGRGRSGSSWPGGGITEGSRGRITEGSQRRRKDHSAGGKDHRRIAAGGHDHDEGIDCFNTSYLGFPPGTSAPSPHHVASLLSPQRPPLITQRSQQQTLTLPFMESSVLYLGWDFAKLPIAWHANAWQTATNAKRDSRSFRPSLWYLRVRGRRGINRHITPFLSSIFLLIMNFWLINSGSYGANSRKEHHRFHCSSRFAPNSGEMTEKSLVSAVNIAHMLL